MSALYTLINKASTNSYKDNILAAHRIHYVSYRMLQVLQNQLNKVDSFFFSLPNVLSSSACPDSSSVCLDSSSVCLHQLKV